MPTPEDWRADAARALASEKSKVTHTRGGLVIGSRELPSIRYGETHDMDCPGCVDTPFTASPRSETYWAS
jgi:hypothetical protein